MHINSALVSAQNRERFYAFNWEVEQPEDRGILLRDILETSTNEINYELKTIGSGLSCDSCEPVRIGDIGSTAQAHRVYSCDGKSVTINSGGGGQGGKTGLYACPIKTLSDGEIDYMFRTKNRMEYGYIQNASNDKAKCITANVSKGVPYNVMIEEADGTLHPIYDVENGLISIKDNKHPIKLADGQYIIRKLTPVECERLQTLPDGYTKAVSNTQRYRGLGNGWTAEVIIHILNGALKDVPRDEEIVVLSMYDGIGTGRYCLDKMGFTNVKYFAYEIDTYAKKVAMSNYPDIIQLGDAFALRHPDWTIGY
jgi:DNA (cytosine-5)-methyltransferase 3A